MNPFINPLLGAFKKENWLAYLIMVLTAAGFTLWMTILAVQSKKDDAADKAQKREEALHRYYGKIIVLKDSVILAKTQENIEDKDERIKRLEEKADRTEDYILESKEHDVRLTKKADRNNTQSKVLESKIKEKLLP